MRKVVWIACVAMLTACADPLGVRFDASVPSSQRSLMASDLGRVSSLVLAPTSSKDLTNLNIGSPTGDALATWISNRLDIVVGENFDYDTYAQLYGGSSSGRYAASSATTVMMNLGSYLYLDAKSKGGQYMISVMGQTIPIYSPRVNIVQIGVGLFTVNAISGVALSATSNSMLRIATYVHEGRHGDGNGTNTGFPHAMCASGDYKGNYACENYANGPYAVQTIFLRMAYGSCYGCSNTELTGLQLSIADYASRQIGSQFSDPTPVGGYL